MFLCPPTTQYDTHTIVVNILCKLDVYKLFSTTAKSFVILDSNFEKKKVLPKHIEQYNKIYYEKIINYLRKQYNNTGNIRSIFTVTALLYKNRFQTKIMSRVPQSKTLAYNVVVRQLNHFEFFNIICYYFYRNK